MRRAYYICEFLGYYVMCSTTHWFVSNMYTNFCTPASFSGIFKTVLLTQTPTCQFLSRVNTYSFSLMNQSITSALSLLIVNYTARNRIKIQSAELK